MNQNSDFFPKILDILYKIKKIHFSKKYINLSKPIPSPHKKINEPKFTN